MTIITAPAQPVPVALYRLTLTALAAALLLAAVSGRSGVQVVDAAVAARMFALHLHSVPGEAEYVREHGGPAPFVHAHCHDSRVQPVPQPGPDEAAAAASLAGALIDPAWVAAPVLHPSCWTNATSGARAPSSRVLPPLSEPPR